MKQELLSQYTTLIDFLGDTLGPDYTVLLYDLENENNSLIAFSSVNPKISPLYNKIPKEMLKLLTDNTFSKKKYCTNLPGKRNEISVDRNSFMIINDSDGNLNGLLCIIFDDSRFIKLHDYLISVAHPLDFVKNHSFHTIHNMEMYEFQKKTDTTPSAASDMNLKNLMQSIYRDAIEKANFSSDRLNQEEKLVIIKYLKEYGFFRLKGAVAYAAKNLGCSSASIYRYLNELKK